MNMISELFDWLVVFNWVVGVDKNCIKCVMVFLRRSGVEAF